MEDLNKQPSKIEKTREEKRALAKKAGLDATNVYLETKNSEPIDMIASFGKNFKAKHGGNFILLHDLIGSSISKEQAEVWALDTDNKDIEKFVTKLNTEI